MLFYKKAYKSLLNNLKKKREFYMLNVKEIQKLQFETDDLDEKTHYWKLWHNEIEKVDIIDEILLDHQRSLN